MKKGASRNVLTAPVSFIMSALRKLPSRNCRSVISASVQIMRVEICSSVISRLNSTTRRGLFFLRMILRIMFNASAVLPIDGRAATTNISPRFSPPVIRSRSGNPVGMPGSSLPLMIRSMCSNAAVTLLLNGTIELASASPRTL
ncbi:hypothetical protein SDC9_127171 [bioreactor metagenome]|uniref:Uncharacterized protein n=1 Tax=bioreactor metagenome TaxID=1076179 RepID=A0A645CTA2_9ZZZZ